MTLPLFNSYRQGVVALIEKLGRNHKQLGAAHVYQQRLIENLDRVVRYGDTETLKAERAEILDQLNGLAQSALGMTFAALCPTSPASNVSPLSVDAPMHSINTGGGTVVMGDVSVSGGDFVGRDSTQIKLPPHESTSTPNTVHLVDTAAMRARLQRLDDVQLDMLCMDHFPVVYDQFGRGLRRDEKCNLLLVYVRRSPAEAARLDSLLARE